MVGPLGQLVDKYLAFSEKKYLYLKCFNTSFISSEKPWT